MGQTGFGLTLRLPMVRQRLLELIDFFYPPFQRVLPRSTFRYAACGGANTVFDIFLYFISYNFILDKQILYTPFGAISPHIAAFLLSFAVTFPLGFLLNRFIVFPGSVLRGRIQLFRYFLLVVVCVILNYVFLKIFVEQFNFFPTISKILTTVIVVSFSYLTQKHFTFKGNTA
jgi:putative flippase GtrA